MLLDLFSLAFLRIKNRLLESIIVILSLGFGLAIVSTVFSMMFTFNAEFQEMDNSPWKRSIDVLPVEYGSNEMVAAERVGSVQALESILFTWDDITRLKESCPTIDYTIIREWVELIPYSPELEHSDEGAWWEVNPTAIGVNNDFLEFHNLELEAGSYFSTEDYLNGNNVIIIGGNLKTLLFKDQNPIGEILTYDNTDYRVVGYLKEDYQTASEKDIEEMRSSRWHDQNKIFLPYTTKSWREDRNKVNSFTLGVKSSLDIEKGLQEVDLYLKQNYPGGAVHTTSYLDWNNSEDTTTKNVLKVIAFIAMVSLVIAALTNLNLMLARVLRDKKGFGISQALGATKKTIFAHTIMESLIIGGLGTILGMILMALFTVFFANILGTSDSVVSMTFNFRNFLINLLLAIFVTGLFSVFPAIEATKIEPSKVLRED